MLPPSTNTPKLSTLPKLQEHAYLYGNPKSPAEVEL
jgi:hypothetical protein